MKYLLLSFVFLAAACNPEVKNIGASSTDVVKYFRVTDANNGIGNGLLIVANIGEKKLMTFYIQQPSGKFAHTDVMIKPSPTSMFALDSVYSQTPNCKLNPDTDQPNYFDELSIGGTVRPLNKAELDREAAMKESRVIGC